MRSEVRLLALALAVAGAWGCERRERPANGFAYEPPAQPISAREVKREVRTTQEGFRVAELHLVFVRVPTEAVARATLQHAIDSATAADTSLRAVRVVGFVVGTPDSTGVADVLPAISGVWAPVDTAAFLAGRRVSFRTHFTILRPLAADGGSAPQR